MTQDEVLEELEELRDELALDPAPTAALIVAEMSVRSARSALWIFARILL